MSKSYKPYAFAVLALAGVYSAQLTVDFMPQYDVIRSIAQEEAVELTAENIKEEVEKHRQFVIDSKKASAEKLEEAKKLTDHKDILKIKKEYNKAQSSFYSEHYSKEAKLKSFISSLSEEEFKTELGKSMVEISELFFSDSSNPDELFEDLIADALALRADKNAEKIASLETMLCEQRQSIADLKEELSSKLSGLTELLTGRSFISSSPLTSPDFDMPWANLQMPFAQMFNPFSFLFGGANQFQGFTQMPQFGLTQNNFYGKTSFENYSFKLPSLEQVQAARGPSQAQSPAQHVPPQNVVVPMSTRGLGHSSEAVAF